MIILLIALTGVVLTLSKGVCGLTHRNSRSSSYWKLWLAKP